MSSKYAVIKVIGLACGHATPFDHKFLVDYDPDVPGTDPEGRPLSCTLTVTDDIEKAQRFFGVNDAIDFYKSISKTRPRRSDGYPNRPLTAFSVAVELREE